MFRLVMVVVLMQLVTPMGWAFEVRSRLTGPRSGQDIWLGATTGAKHEILVYFDFTCQECKKFSGELLRLLKNRHDVRVVFRNYNLTSDCQKDPWLHQACQLALWSRCAFQYERFESFLDHFYNDSLPRTPNNHRLGAILSLSEAALHKCVQSESTKTALTKEVKSGRDLRIQSTPFILIDGVPYSGERSFSGLQRGLASPMSVNAW